MMPRNRKIRVEYEKTDRKKSKPGSKNESTIENYMIKEDENKFFDRKSAQLKPSDIADEISAYANAEGGTIVFGISDNRNTKRNFLI